MDLIYAGVVALNRLGYRAMAALQTGELRWYATTFVVALIGVMAIALRSAA